MANLVRPIRFENLTLGYDRRPAVHHLAGEIAPGSLLAVVGPNGAGKSTLLKGLSGALAPLTGSIDRGQLNPREIAYLPQAAEIDRTFPISVFDLISMGAWSGGRRSGLGWFAGLGFETRARAQDALASVGLAGFENRPIGTLSGGQMQRALFARLLLQNAPVILLDEPFTAIDQRTTADLLALVQRWHGERRTVIAVLHDLDLVRGQFPETLLLAREPVAWGRTAEVLHPENLLKARRMVESFDHEAEVCGRAA